MPPFWRTNDGDVIKDALRRLDAQYLDGKKVELRD
jgi:ATP-dependent DNA helicase DinG